jgi:hypothetical protein
MGISWKMDREKVNSKARNEDRDREIDKDRDNKRDRVCTCVGGRA